MEFARRSLLAAGLAVALATPFVFAADADKGAAPKGAAAEASMDTLKDAVRANRKALVATNMQLSDDEAKKFWPAYDSYQKDMNGVQDRMIKLIDQYAKSFKTMSDDEAMKLAKDYLEIESDRAKVRRDHLDEIAKAVPGKKVARFYQIENKMDAIIRYDLAKTIPVVE
jgi:hypothetical protein